MKYKSNPYKNKLEDVQEFWKSPDEANEPREYYKYIERSEYLVNDIFIEKLGINCKSRILEIGCNCGRNLNYLEMKGYEDLTGIEISKNAVEFSKRAYLNLNANIMNNSVENTIKKFNTGYFNVVFTMAVLMHIHNESSWVFEEMKRIASEHIIIIEDNKRPYKDIFTRKFSNRIFLQIDEHKTNKYFECADKYTTRIFERSVLDYV